jgi:HK97 family phage portal protein
MMAEVQLSSGLWVPGTVVEGKSDRIAEAAYGHGPVPDWSAVSKFRDYSSYLRAIKVAYVWAAVSVIAYNFAATPYALWDDDDEQEDPDDPLLALMARPNPNQSGFRFLEQLIYYLELTGNAYVTLEEVDASGQPREMYLPNPARMRIKPGPDGVQGYVYDSSPSGRSGGIASSTLIPYEPDEVIHIAYPAILDGYYGVGNVEASEQLLNIVTAMAQQEFAYWDSGGRIIGVLETDHRLSDADFLRLKRDWQLASMDKRQRVRTAILEQGLKYTPIAEGMRALDLVNIDRNKRDQVLAVFGVPLPKIGIMEMAQYKMDEADAFFWQETMAPKFVRFEDAWQALVDRYNPRLRLQFTRKTFEDDQYKITAAQTMLLNSICTIDEARSLVGLPVLPNGNGQVILVSNLVMPVHVTDVGEVATNAATPPPAPAPAVAPGGAAPATGGHGEGTAGASEEEGGGHGGIVHLADHLPPTSKAAVLAGVERWHQIEEERKAALRRDSARRRVRSLPPMERAARLYRNRARSPDA